MMVVLADAKFGAHFRKLFTKPKEDGLARHGFYSAIRNQAYEYIPWVTY